MPDDRLPSARIDVAICFDARMLEAAYVMLASVKAHARPERPIRVFAVTDFVSPDLGALAAAMSDARFELVPLPCTNTHGSFPVRDHITAGTYLRFLLPDLLPDVDKLVYLDVDLVVHRDLASLYDVPLDGAALAAVPDWPMLVGSLTWADFTVPSQARQLRFAAYLRDVLGLEGDDAYFNCGVMVLDLARWRADDIAGRTVRHLNDNPGLFYMDQDALNVIVAGRYLRLDARWNAFANCSFPAWVSLLVRLTAAGRRWEAIRTTWRRDPWIVHYAGGNKPWVATDPRTACDALWWSYATLSPRRAAVVTAYRAGESTADRRRSKVPVRLRDDGAAV